MADASLIGRGRTGGVVCWKLPYSSDSERRRKKAEIMGGPSVPDR